MIEFFEQLVLASTFAAYADYVDFQSSRRRCLRDGEGCMHIGCWVAHAPSGGW